MGVNYLKLALIMVLVASSSIYSRIRVECTRYCLNDALFAMENGALANYFQDNQLETNADLFRLINFISDGAYQPVDMFNINRLVGYLGVAEIGMLPNDRHLESDDTPLSNAVLQAIGASDEYSLYIDVNGAEPELLVI